MLSKRAAVKRGARKAKVSGKTGGSGDLSRADILSFRQEASQPCFSILTEAVKLFLLQISMGIKRAGIIDGLTGSDGASISALRELLARSGVTAIVREGAFAPKIFLSKTPQDAKELSRLHEEVIGSPGFVRSPGDHGWHRQYGALLGYPSCCVASYASTSVCGSIWDPFFALSGIRKDRPRICSIDPLLNSMASIPLIFHVPCSQNCKASLEAAHLAAGLYCLYDQNTALRVLSLLRVPVIVFRDGYFIRLFGKLDGDVLAYVSSEAIDCDAVERGEPSEGEGAVPKTLGAVRRGDRLVFSEKGFQVLEGSASLRVHTSVAGRYVLLVPCGLQGCGPALE